MTWSERDRPARALAAALPPAAFLLALLALLGMPGCGRAPREGFLLVPLVAAGRFEVSPGDESGQGGLAFTDKPRLEPVEIDHERRRAVVTGEGTWRWRGRVPEGARLVAGVQALPAAGAGGLEVTVSLRDGLDGEVLDVARDVPNPEGPRWLSLAADLARYGGREVSLEFSAALADGRQGGRIAWGPVSLAPPGRPAGEEPTRPNILFILVDTLRRDRLTPYGYTRQTTPEIARWLAAPGAVVEQAYSQAPWTLPSVVSFLTGRYPGEMLSEDLATYGIPLGVPSLAERLAALGYETGAFIANPSLHAGAGFERGFSTFFAPPADVEWIRKHADLVNGHALPWLAAHQGGTRPFFAYVHYIDPHDPYENPEVVNNRSPFLPDYDGPVTGEWIHGIYIGRQALPDPPRDVAHINALYDSEVHYVDRAIGELLASLAPEALADTLIVLTSDHGEELFDHGGWKHGQTLYEEQIHVPLLLRWDGHIPGGKRLAGTVRLLDLVPTLVGVAGGEDDPAWDGVDLLPALAGGKPLPERPAFSQHLTSGPLRAAVIEDGKKLILFNKEAPFTPADEIQAHLWRTDLARFAREELYDLARDPGERRNLLSARLSDGPATERSGGAAGRAAGPVAGQAAGGPAPAGAGVGDGRLPPRLAGALHRQLDRQLPGLRVVAGAAPAGSRLGGSIRFERPPERWTPYFLAPGDRVTLAGDRLDFDLGGEGGDGLAKGMLIEGDFGAVRSIEARRDGAPLGPGAVRLGEGAPYGGGPVAPRLLVAPSWPVAGPGQTGPSGQPGALYLWLHPPERGGERRRERDPETERRLRNLGYIK